MSYVVQTRVVVATPSRTCSCADARIWSVGRNSWCKERRGFGGPLESKWAIALKGDASIDARILEAANRDGLGRPTLISRRRRPLGGSLGAIDTRDNCRAVALHELREVLLPVGTQISVFLLGRRHGGQVRGVHLPATTTRARRSSSTSGAPGPRCVAHDDTDGLDKLLDRIQPRVKPNVEILRGLRRSSDSNHFREFAAVNSLGWRAASHIRPSSSMLTTAKEKCRDSVGHHSSINGSSTVEKARCAQSCPGRLSTDGWEARLRKYRMFPLIRTLLNSEADTYL